MKENDIFHSIDCYNMKSRMSLKGLCAKDLVLSAVLLGSGTALKRKGLADAGH